MECRYATQYDYIPVIRAIQNKRISFITSTQIKEDIKNGRLVLCIDNEKIVGMCALVYDSNYNYTALKRFLIPNKKNCGRGIGRELLSFVCQLGIDNLGATPWNTNITMIHLLEKFGFKYQYTFNEVWTFYKR